MATLGTALISKIAGDNPAEKAFKPWWDNAQNFLVYGLVMLGLIVAPTAIINGTPLDCTRCTGVNCILQNGTNFGGDKTSEEEDPKFNAWWIKKYCTHNNPHMNAYLMYFPYILLILALVLVLIERGFISAFKTGELLDNFYHILVKDEDKNNDDLHLDLDQSRHAIEICNRFSKKSNYWLSYVIRSSAELLVALVLLVWVSVFGIPYLAAGENVWYEGVMPCNVYGHMYECSGHPTQFYQYITIMVVVILLFYVLLAVSSLAWMAAPNLGKLSSVMHSYRIYLRKNENSSIVSDEELLGNLNDIYYNNRDLNLLLNLLAESSGLATSLRILALFDEEFRARMQPSHVTIDKMLEQSNDEVAYDVKVSFQHAEAVKDIFNNVNDFTHLYTVEISPPAEGSPQVTSIRIGSDGLPKKGPSVYSHEYDHDEADDGGGDTVALKMTKVPTMPTMAVSLDGLRRDLDYTIRVCTVINGHTVAKKTEKLSAVNKKKAEE